MNLAKEHGVSNLFVAHYDTNLTACSVWLLDNTCSDHMTGVMEFLRSLMKVRN